MTILWCGGEEIDFYPRSQVFVSTSTSYKKSLARCSVYFNNSGFGYIDLDAALPETFWVHFNYGLTSGGTSSVFTSSVCCVRESLISSSGIYIRRYHSGVNSPVYFKLAYYDGSFTDLTGTGESLGYGVHQVDLNVKYAVNGFINLFVDNQLYLSYAGDTTVGEATSLSTLKFFNNYNVGTESAEFHFSEIIVADESTRLMRLNTLVPNSVGDTNTWTNDYDSIDEADFNESETVYTDAIEQDFQCNFTDGEMPASNFICKAVAVSVSAADGVGGVGLQSGIKTNSAVHLGNTKSLDLYWKPVKEIYQVNPETSNPFTPAEIDALQLAFRSKSI